MENSIEKQWLISTPIDQIMVTIDFFKNIKINEIRAVGHAIFLNIDQNHTISIYDKDWKEVQILLREIKINKIINE